MARNPSPSELQRYARAMARKYGVPEEIFMRQIGAESAWRSKATSSAGAQGVAQIMPFHDVDPNKPGLQHSGVDPYKDLEWAAQHDASNLKKYGNVNDMLSVYNSGRPWAQGQNIGETNSYVKGITSGALGGSVSPSNGQQAMDPTQSMGDSSGRLTDPRKMMALQLLNKGRARRGENELGGGLLQFAMQRQQVDAANQTFGSQPSANTPLTPGASGVVAEAKKYLGTPYLWGGEKPGGFDCSGLLQYVWGKGGVQIPRTSQDQWHAGVAVPKGQLQPGDAVFFHPGSKGPQHVGMYVGGGKFIEAPHTGATVRVSTLTGRSDYIGARRFGGK